MADRHPIDRALDCLADYERAIKGDNYNVNPDYPAQGRPGGRVNPVTVDTYHDFVCFMVHTGEVVEEGASHLFAFQAFTQVSAARPSIRLEPFGEGTRMLIIWRGDGIDLVYEVDQRVEAFSEYGKVCVKDAEYGSVFVLGDDDILAKTIAERELH